jgi:hypothetical protein
MWVDALLEYRGARRERDISHIAVKLVVVGEL